ncbi:MAG: chemotaxis protein CheD [Acidobacteriota bacterium]|nr:chemotaxis protein CheD [Acidobacteriota bacterium]
MAAAGGECVVGVGDCRVAVFNQEGGFASLGTYALGSCIAVIAYDWRAKAGGLLHVMLPESAMDLARAAGNPYVYADTGVPALFRALAEIGGTRTKTRCCIAGGASMMAGSSHFEIGKKNYLAVRKSLWKLGMLVDREDVGGAETRSVRLDLETGRVDLRKGTARGTILAPARINLIERIVQNARIDR